MSTVLGLQEALLEGGLERVSWWNGRILTAEDLADQQRASDEADRLLGRAIGPGIVRGLAARTGSDRRSVLVDAGLAVDRAGEVLALPREVRVPLVDVPGGGSADGETAAGFLSCQDLPAVLRATGDGVYLLTIGSAAGTRGTASGADRRGTATRECGPRYQVAGVQFRLVWLDAEGLARDAGHDPSDQEVLRFDAEHPRERNVVSALLLDTVARRVASRDPFAEGASRPPLLDQLHDERVLVDCEVPLAVISWRSGAIGFTDAWAVRRPPLAGQDPWPAAALDGRLAAVGLATFQQFSQHLGELIAQGGARTVNEAIRYMPPAFFLHVPDDAEPSESAPATYLGMHAGPTTAGVGSRRVAQASLLAPGSLWPLLRASLDAAPLDADRRDSNVMLRVGSGDTTLLIVSRDLVHLARVIVEDAVEDDDPATDEPDITDDTDVGDADQDGNGHDHEPDDTQFDPGGDPDPGPDPE